jgi:hypothetical protein
MTANIEVARPAGAPGAVIPRGPGQPLPPRLASRQRDAILIVILLAAAARSAQQAKAAGAQTWRGQGEPLPPRPVSRQRAAILIAVALASAADLTAVAMFAIVLAAIRDLVRDSQVIPRALGWYFGPVSTWHMRRLKRRYLRQQMLDAPARLGIFVAAGKPISRVRERWNVTRRCAWTNRGHLVRNAGMARLACADGCWTRPGTRLAARAGPCC